MTEINETGVAPSESGPEPAKTNSAKDRWSAEDMQAALKHYLKPNKRNAALVTAAGTALMLIQCARAGYLPELDWSTGAGSVVLIAVFAVAMFAMAFVTLLTAMPALPLAAEKEEISKPYLWAGLGLLLVWCLLFVSISVLWQVGVIKAVPQRQWVGWIFVALVFGGSALAAYLAARRQRKVVSKDLWVYWVGNYTGLLVLPWVYMFVLIIFSRYQGASLDDAIVCPVLAAIPMVLVLGLTILRPKGPAIYQAAVILIFGFLAVPTSDAAFSVLGLGRRTVEFHLAKPEYKADLARGGMKPVPDGTTKEGSEGEIYRVYLRLRLGSEIAVSVDGKEWGTKANVVAIPRDAIRGLRFVPPAEDHRKRSVEEGRNPSHLIEASKQWSLQQAARQLLADREEKWKAAQKNELSPAQVEWLKWARETTTQLAPFADGYPVLANDNHPVPQSVGADESAKTRGDPDAASPKP